MTPAPTRSPRRPPAGFCSSCGKDYAPRNAMHEMMHWCDDCMVGYFRNTLSPPVADARPRPAVPLNALPRTTVLPLIACTRCGAQTVFRVGQSLAHTRCIAVDPWTKVPCGNVGARLVAWGGDG